MQCKIDIIVEMAAKRRQQSAQLPIYNRPGPDNALSRSIRNKKEAEQFQATLKAVISHA